MRRRLHISDTRLAGVRIVERERLADRRGFLSRLFCADELADAGWIRPIAQINQTVTARVGAVRGLHFQIAPHAEMKLVMCLQGEVFDVAVDLRRGSQTFLGWHGEHLTASNNRALLIPEGCAHGFQTLSPDVELLYLHSQAYVREAEAAFSPLEPRLAITWPLSVSEMSDRDASHPPMKEAFDGVPL
jgi:dTDP-4-dehydrorhamnose 3,5-epimerase